MVAGKGRGAALPQTPGSGCGRPTGVWTFVAAAGSSGRGYPGSSLGALGHSLPPPMGIREFPGGAPRAKSIAV